MFYKVSNVLLDILYFLIVGTILAKVGLTLTDWKFWVLLVAFIVIDDLRWYLKKSYEKWSKEDDTSGN